MTMRTTTIDRQLARLARHIAGADETGPTRSPERPTAGVEAQRRAQSVARDVVEQLGATVAAGEDEIDAALELVLARLMSPASTRNESNEPTELIAA